MKIGLIATVGFNIGDDFIREGICSVLREVFRGKDIQFTIVDKHHPFTAYPWWHPYQLARHTHYLPRGSYRANIWLGKYASPLAHSVLDSCDLVVQCGAPIAWYSCSSIWWADPLWKNTIARISQKGVPVLNLGVGSNYPWERQPSSIDDSSVDGASDAKYLTDILSYCRFTTVRDKLLQKLFHNLGSDCPFIPCPAFLAGKQFVTPHSNGDIFLINYMEGGGHFDFKQHIDASAWRETVKNIVQNVKRTQPVVFLCHDQKEYELADTIDPSLPRVLPKSLREYFSIIMLAKMGLCNRLHASMALAGLGIPSVAVGADTRLLMVDGVGLPTLYVKDATQDRIEALLDKLSHRLPAERNRLLCLREETHAEYIGAVKRTLSV